MTAAEMVAALGALLDWPLVFLIQREWDMERLGAAVLRERADTDWMLVSWGECQRAAREFLGLDA